MKVVLIIIVLLHCALSFYVFILTNKSANRRSKIRASLPVIWIKDWLITPIIISLIITYIFFDQLDFWKIVTLSTNYEVKVIGLLVVCLGFILKYLAYQNLRSNWSAKLNIYSDHQLIIRGPYMFWKHPVYASYLITFIGFFLFSGNLLFFFLTLIYYALNFFRAKSEEKLLSKKFNGEYLNHLSCVKTRRLICIAILLFIMSIIGGIDEVIYWPITGRSFTLELGYKLWLQLTS